MRIFRTILFLLCAICILNFSYAQKKPVVKKKIEQKAPAPKKVSQPKPVISAEQIAREKENATWKLVKSIDSQEAYESYLKEYPKGIFGLEAKNKIRIFENKAKVEEREKERERLDLIEAEKWKIVNSIGSQKAYEEYLDSYPNGKYATEAINKISTFMHIEDPDSEKKEIKLRNKIEEEKWSEVKLLDSQKAYEDYLNIYPNGKYVSDAKNKINSFEQLNKAEFEKREQKILDQIEEERWKSTKNINTGEGYRDFLESYPNSKFVSEAENEIKKINSLGSPTNYFMKDMVLVEGGIFEMGCTGLLDCLDNENPAHSVKLSNYYIGKYPVTQQQWRNIMGKDPSNLYNKGCNDCPIEGVSWYEVQKFLRKLNRLSGMNFRLPTEAEWEFAARGGINSYGFIYSGSNDIQEVAWFNENSNLKTQPVGQKKGNELGIHDMNGNVLEWCNDIYSQDYYKNSDYINPQGPNKGKNRVLRGGGWNIDAGFCRNTVRFNTSPETNKWNYGFRLAL